jgi:DNA helicase-2/ATP-dependent DNA helicase PcrA
MLTRMGVTVQQQGEAMVVQHAAAHDGRKRVRLVAGPGTGKSSTIEERIAWLLKNDVGAEEIWAVSFTRASARDLKERVHAYCARQGRDGADQVRISTIHSLALRTLRKAGLLAYYPVDPLVLDNWELENIFDAEFGKSAGIGKKRREEIRLDHEAFWSTGQWGPPNYIPPTVPVTQEERQAFESFHRPRTQAYACVLPGELVRQCVEHINSGTLDPVVLLGLRHLIVDEFQDLNPLDLEFINALASRGVVLFVAGDDDQSIYSFRPASPAGIQNFVKLNPACGQHTLTNCFRCTPAVLHAAQTLIGANAGPNRIPKRLVSLYTASEPPVDGSVFRFRFGRDQDEASAITETCRDLIAAGMPPRDILILLSKRSLGQPLAEEMERLNVPCDPLAAPRIHDTEIGRLLLALMRIICSSNDYVAHRTVLGLSDGCGIGTCTSICDKVIQNNLNFRNLFYHDLPGGVFKGRERNAITEAAQRMRQVAEWGKEDVLSDRLSTLTSILNVRFGEEATAPWREYASHLPAGMTMQELCDVIWTSKKPCCWRQPTAGSGSRCQRRRCSLSAFVS